MNPSHSLYIDGLIAVAVQILLNCDVIFFKINISCFFFLALRLNGAVFHGALCLLKLIMSLGNFVKGA